ncbi:MAG: polysaccharide biosynthesis tyrosine autokinase [Bacteroidetes bacterium]|nr:polysaccharide biosynthesis tyrosine autokinase [Bacteroidota bacterium]
MNTRRKTVLHPLQRLLGKEFNPKLFFTTIKKNLLWAILITVLAYGITKVYLRYTIPEYEARARVMIKAENKAQVLDIKQFSNFRKDNIQAEIEMMKSNLILSEIVETLPLSISYFKMGKFASTELYKSSPFKLEVLVKKPVIYGIPFEVVIIDHEKYIISYKVNEQEYNKTVAFKQDYETDNFELSLELTNAAFLQSQNNGLEGKYFFMLNDVNSISRTLLQNLQVYVVNAEASIVQITYTDRQAIKAADIVNTLAEKYLARDGESRTKSTSLIMSFIDEQLSSVGDELRKTEEAIRNFKVENKFIDINNKESDILIGFRNLEQEQIELELEESTIDWFLDFVETENDVTNIAPLLSLASTYVFSTLVKKLVDLQDRKEEIMMHVTVNSPSVKLLDNQMKNVRIALISSIENYQKSLVAKRIDLEEQMQRYDDDFKSLPEKEAQYLHLKRLSSIQEKFYLLLLDKRSEFAITKAGFVPGNIILEHALVPTVPIYPKRSLIQIIGLSIGLLISLVLILTKYMMHHNILSLSDFERYSDAAVLGIVPSASKRQEDINLVVTTNPKSLISEAFRSIRMNLQFISNEPGPKTIIVTSTISAEGKTFIALNLGASLTMMGKKVIILDFDMRKPKIQRAFNTMNTRGVSTILIGEDKIDDNIQSYEMENADLFSSKVRQLDFITAGPIPPNPSELIISGKTDELIDHLKTKYDYIIIDSPPVGLVADAMYLLKKVDYPIYVLRADYSSRDFINNINWLMSENKISKLSIILNDVGKGGSGYGYGYGQGYAYGYGYGYGQGDNGGYYQEEKKKKSFLQKILPFLS